MKILKFGCETLPVLLAVLVFVVVNCTASFSCDYWINGHCVTRSQLIDSVYSKINDIRVAKGKNALVVDRGIQRSASRWAFLGGGTRKKIVHDALWITFHRRRNPGECIAISADDPTEVWLSSYRHRNILLGNYRHIGLGFNGWRWVLRVTK